MQKKKEIPMSNFNILIDFEGEPNKNLMTLKWKIMKEMQRSWKSVREEWKEKLFFSQQNLLL